MKKLTFFQLVNNPIDRDLVDPITLDLLVDPVIISSGITFSRSSILKWFSTSNTCPVTRRICDSSLIPNYFASQQVDNYKNQFICESFFWIKKNLKDDTNIEECYMLIKKLQQFLTFEKDIIKFLKFYCKILLKKFLVVESVKLSLKLIYDFNRTRVGVKILELSLEYAQKKKLKIYIFQQIINHGGNCLTPKQQFFYLTKIIELYNSDNCKCYLTRIYLKIIENKINQLCLCENEMKLEKVKLLTEIIPLQVYIYKNSVEMLNKFIKLAKLSKNEKKESILILTKAIEMSKKQIDDVNEEGYKKRLSIVYNNRGILVGSVSKNYNEELNDLDISIKLFPTAKKICNRGVCYENLGKVEEAMKDYNESLKLLPNYKRCIELKNELKNFVGEKKMY